MATMRMRTKQPVAISLLVLGLWSQPAVASHHGWSQASSIGRDVLVAASLGLPAAHEDWNGAIEAAGSMAAAELVTIGLKEAFPERRPDGSDRKSFPSAHASVAFAAAASLDRRYGWKVGLPATLVAAFVAAGRVEARKHHWYDVAAGAAIGEASGLLITRSRDGERLVPWGDAHGGGISFATRF